MERRVSRLGFDSLKSWKISKSSETKQLTTLRGYVIISPSYYLWHKCIFLCCIDKNGIVIHIRREVQEVARFDDRATSTTPKL